MALEGEDGAGEKGGEKGKVKSWENKKAIETGFSLSPKVPGDTIRCHHIWKARPLVEELSCIGSNSSFVWITPNYFTSTRLVSMFDNSLQVAVRRIPPTVRSSSRD